jgi:hypothetical protein
MLLKENDRPAFTVMTNNDTTTTAMRIYILVLAASHTMDVMSRLAATSIGDNIRSSTVMAASTKMYDMTMKPK